MNGPAVQKGGCALLSVTAVALSLAACGGSSSTGGSSSQGSANVPVQVARNTPPIPRSLGAGAAHPTTGAVHATRKHPVKGREQPGTVDDEINSSGARSLDPCALVSRAEAQAILRKPVGRPVSAPQGPTCIYSPRGSKNVVTLAVQSLKFSKVKPQARLRDRMSVTVSGHTAYCGVAGTPTMILPLPAGRFLTITAPCPVAATFAAKALAHIPS